MRHCSQCKNSEYVIRRSDNAKVLECHKCQELGIPRYMKTNCVRAATCGLFNPERLRDAPVKNKRAWEGACVESGISLVGLSYERRNT